MSLDLSRWENRTLQWNIREVSAIGIASELSGANKQSIDFCFAHWWVLSGSLLSILLYYSIFHLYFCSTYTLLRSCPVHACAVYLASVMGRSVPLESWEGLNVTWANFSCVLHKDSFTRFPKQRNCDGNVIRRFRFMSVNELCLISEIFCFGCGCICA